jgi:hypothetical protein
MHEQPTPRTEIPHHCFYTRLLSFLDRHQRLQVFTVLFSRTAPLDCGNIAAGRGPNTGEETQAVLNKYDIVYTYSGFVLSCPVLSRLGCQTYR